MIMKIRHIFILFIALVLVLPTQATEGSFTITFKETGTTSDGSAQQTEIANIIQSGEEYVSAVTADRVYNARTGRGIKLGASAYTGSLELTLNDSVKVTSIVVNAMWYKDGEATLQIQDKSDYVLTDSMKPYTYTYDTATAITSLYLATTFRRNYIQSVTVNYEVEGGETPQESTKYYLKNNWNGAEEWTWKEMSKLDDGTYMLAEVVFGGEGVDINSEQKDETSKWILSADINTFNAAYEPATLGALDTVVFFFDPEAVNVYTGENGLSALIIGKYVEPVMPPAETKYYIENNWDNGEWEWKEMNKVTETIWMLENVVVGEGGGGLYFNTTQYEVGAWVSYDTINAYLYPSLTKAELSGLDTVSFIYLSSKTAFVPYDVEQGLSALILGKHVEPVQPTLPQVSIAGDMNSWDANANIFTPAADEQTASVTMHLETNASEGYAFKVVVDGNWLCYPRNDLGEPFTFTRTNNSVKVPNYNGNENDIFWIYVDTIGDYTFTWTYADSTLTVSYPTQEPTPIVINAWDEITFSEIVYATDMPSYTSFANEGSDFAVTITNNVAKMSIDDGYANFGTADSIVYYDHRLKTGGKSTADNNISLNIPEDGLLRIAARSANNSDYSRTLVLTQDDVEIYNKPVNEDNSIVVENSDLSTTTVYQYITVNVKKGTVELTYPVSGLNFYSFAFMKEEEPGPVEPVKPIGDVDFNPTDFAGMGVANEGGEIFLEKDGVSFYCDRGYGTDSLGVRCYKGSTVIISSSIALIDSIVFDFNGSSYNGNLETLQIVNDFQWSATVDKQARMYRISIFLSEGQPIVLTVTPNNSEWGSVTGGGTYGYGKEVTITATPNQGYEFVQWSDSVTENPRTIVLTQDTAFTAIFRLIYIPNHYTVILHANNDLYGMVEGAGMYEEGSEVTITATPKLGYNFIQWSDSVTDNPRIITLTQDTVFTAIFETQFTDYLSVAQAIEKTMALEDGQTDTVEVAVMGYVVNAGEYNWDYHQQIFFLADGQDTTQEQFLQGYRCSAILDGELVPVLNGDQIFLTGKLTKYIDYDNTVIPEISHGTAIFIDMVEGDRREPRPDTITVDQAVQIGMELDSAATSEREYVVVGYVHDAETFSTTFRDQNWFMSDARFYPNGDFEAYHCCAISGTDTLKVVNGDRVQLTGRLTKYWNNAESKFIIEIKNGVAEFLSMAAGDHTVDFTVDRISVAEALEIGNTLAVGQFTEKTYEVLGYVSAIMGNAGDYSSYGTQIFWISDDKLSTATTNAENAFYVYRGKPNQELILHDQVIVKTAIYRYKQNLIESETGNEVTFIQHYVPEYFTITATANNAKLGSVEGSGRYAEGTSVLLKATPSQGCRFIRWEDGHTQSLRSVKVYEDATYTAIFAAIPGNGNDHIGDNMDKRNDIINPWQGQKNAQVKDQQADTENGTSTAQPQKVIINGQLYIISPEGYIYNALGQLVIQ